MAAAPIFGGPSKANSGRNATPYPDGGLRPLAILTDKSGRQIGFVENELMVEFATENDLNAFLSKWKGTVLATDRPETLGIKANPTYLIRVQTETADVSQLTDNLASLNPKGGSAITVSTVAAQRLIAMGAETAKGGKHVGINFLISPAFFQDGQSAEAPMGGTKYGVGRLGSQSL